ncbi:MAG TPA: uridine kinase, partial [Candidatus Glassbacteria bacterium]|nr:uridine kinase [Candidatus Glassbacteria bacterium]
MAGSKQDLSRIHVKSRFMRESLIDKQVIDSTATDKQVAILPQHNVVMIGGKSIMDRGKKAVFPLVDEILENKDKHGMILSVSGGLRLRHSYSVALDLGIPPGGLTMLAGTIEEQNCRMLYGLLAKHGGVRMVRDNFEELAMYLYSGMLPIVVPMPPHFWWEKPPKYGNIPEYGSDYWIFMFAEVLGAKSLIYVKDQDGLYTADPSKDPKAEFIPKIRLDELIAMDLNELIIERKVLDVMIRARKIKRIVI